MDPHFGNLHLGLFLSLLSKIVRDKIAKQLKKVATTALNGLDPSNELEKTGMLGQNIARAWFTNPDNAWAPNSPVTIAMKGSDKPLIDTAEMRKAIVYVVTNGT